MEYTKLGRTGLDVSRICLGCMSYGEGDQGNHAWSLGEEESRPFIKRALEAGINFFDTANRYPLGSSEEILGRAINDFVRRDEIVIATKVVLLFGCAPRILLTRWRRCANGSIAIGMSRPGSFVISTEMQSTFPWSFLTIRRVRRSHRGSAAKNPSGRHRSQVELVTPSQAGSWDPFARGFLAARKRQTGLRMPG